MCNSVAPWRPLSTTEIKNMSRRPCQAATTAPQSSVNSDCLDDALIEAISHHQAGRTFEAEKLYLTILDSPSGHAVASYGFAMLCATQGRLREAIDAYRHAIVMRPNFVDAYINLGTAHLAIGQGEEAVALYRQAIAISPGNAMAHGNLGKALQDLGRIDEAIAAYRAAIDRQPDNAVMHANFGAALLERRAWDDAMTVTRHAIALQPENAMAHANLGTSLLNLGRREEALAACQQAVALQPQGVAMHASLGGAMLELGAFREAVALCRQAITLDPTQPHAYFNLSHAFKAMNQLDDAAFAARQAIALCPNSAEYHFHMAHILLLQGELSAGWAEYDWRWKLPDFAWICALHGAFSQPLWTGEDISDKTILIYTEQGLGDGVLFARYLSLVVRKASRVIVAAQPPIRRLLETIEGITVVSIRELPLPHFDVHCPLLSLPRAFATTFDNIPAAVPYLRVDPAEQIRWARRIASNRIGGRDLRVGLVWAGNPTTRRDYFRSPGLNSVAPLLSVPGVNFVLLQVGAGREDRDASPLPDHVLDLGAEVADLADTAAIMAGLDLMISSCTASLHLAGALAVQTWAMIPFAPYFPWLLERTDSLWYPSMRLYRQEQPGQDWSGVVGRIATDLAALVRDRPEGSSRSSTESRRSASADDASREDVSERVQMTGTAMTKHHAPGSEAGGFNELAPCRGGLMLYNRNDVYIGASLRKYGEFSEEETALFRMIVQPGRTVLDIGANIGVHTIDLSRLAGPSGVVHAFEPQRLVFQVLCANMALNSCTNVFTHRAAVGAAGDTIMVPSLDPGERHNYGGLSLLGSQQGEPVPVVTIDSLDLCDCQFIKLDVEGMETEALRGAVATIKRFRPILYVENDRQARSAELIGLVQQYGYRLYWHLPPIYSANNFRADPENIFGNTVSVNMICIPIEIPQSCLTNLREVTGPTDSVIRW
jgi:FkbM family methyltransferase